MLDAMQGHVGRIVRDIGLVEAYGPNPNAQMRLQMDLALRADGEAKRVGFGVGIFRPNVEGLWHTLNGTASSPANELAASIGKNVRDVQGFKLAGTLLKSFPDVATYFVTTGYNKLSYYQAIANLWRVGASAETREWAAMHGILSDSAMRALNRYSAENIRQSWAGRLSNSVMKLSLLNAWTDWLSAGFGLTKMGALGKLAGKEWGEISQWDRILMERHGVTADDWAIVRKAQTEERYGIPMLTPDSIVATGHERAYQVADKILGLIKDETSYAVIKPDLMTRTVQTWNGTQAGTGLGEFARATMLFKSFPIAMITRHWRRMMDMPTVTDGSAPWLANRGVYMGALMVSTTALGAISLQASNIVKGRDPINMFGEHGFKFWLQAFAIGGGGGFYSDLLTRDSSQDRSAMDAIGKGVGGPVLGDLSSLYQLTKGSLDDKLAGKKTHAAAEGLQMARSKVPYLDLWYAKAALDHAGMHALQENLSPGYLGKMQAKAQKDWGTASWWRPGTGLPQRAPDLGKAFGQ